MNKIRIPIFVLNLKSRVDRKQHILLLLQNQINTKSDYIIICEDDSEFTEHYSMDILYRQIHEAQEKVADILLGGVSWFKDAIQISKNLFWVEKFSGLRFTIIFKKFYEKILSATFSKTDAADYKISSLSDKKFIVYPFISTQKEFGYSDVTNKNNEAGFVERIFKESSERLRLLSNVNSFYKTI